MPVYMYTCDCALCRPQFMTLYVEEPDHSGHLAGPNSALVSNHYALLIAGGLSTDEGILIDVIDGSIVSMALYTSCLWQ